MVLLDALFAETGFLELPVYVGGEHKRTACHLSGQAAEASIPKLFR